MRIETQGNVQFFLESITTAVLAVKCVIVDKDFTLLGVMKHILPNAQIILCTFHVAKTFRKERSNIQCISAERDTVRKSLASMLYANSEKDYQTSFDELKKDAPEKFLRF